MKAAREVGSHRICRYAICGVLLRIFALMPTPLLRAAFLRLLGASIGKDAIIGKIRFINVDRAGFPSIQAGDSVYIGDDALIDLARGVVLGDHVTIGQRANLISHLNVGYRDHPLQAAFPPKAQPIVIGSGSFIGVAATVLPGVRIGERAFVAAGAVVDRDVSPGRLVAGVPARDIRGVDEAS